jgi:hypothetical protein
MPHYKAIVLLKAKNAKTSDTIPITIEANNAIHAKAILQDQYGEGSVKEVKRSELPPALIEDNDNEDRSFASA